MRYDSDILYRPPGEWKSYLLQCTIGCSYNKCTFCAMYKEKKFRIRPVEEILEDIDMARDYYGPGLKRVFLMDGDAVIMKTDDLIRVLRKLYDTLKQHGRVHPRPGQGGGVGRQQGVGLISFPWEGNEICRLDACQGRRTVKGQGQLKARFGRPDLGS